MAKCPVHMIVYVFAPLSMRLCVWLCVFLQSFALLHVSVLELQTFWVQATPTVTPPFSQWSAAGIMYSCGLTRKLT